MMNASDKLMEKVCETYREYVMNPNEETHKAYKDAEREYVNNYLKSMGN